MFDEPFEIVSKPILFKEDTETLIYELNLGLYSQFFSTEIRIFNKNDDTVNTELYVDMSITGDNIIDKAMYEKLMYDRQSETSI